MPSSLPLGDDSEDMMLPTFTNANADSLSQEKPLVTCETSLVVATQQLESGLSQSLSIDTGNIFSDNMMLPTALAAPLSPHINGVQALQDPQTISPPVSTGSSQVYT